jgi:hypothetical protein
MIVASRCSKMLLRGTPTLINHLQIPSRILYVRYSPISLGACFFFILVEQQAHDSALRASRLRKCIRPCSVQYPIALQSIMYIAHKFTLENRLSLDSLISMVVTVLRCAN